MGATYTSVATLHTIECSCGGVYAITESSYEQHRKEGTCWNCPYCRTGWGFANNGENARLKRELEAERNALARERARHDQTKADRDHIERRRRATVGHLRRTRNRIAAGVCPCCNRTFSNLAAHMKGKHPEFYKEEAPHGT